MAGPVLLGLDRTRRALEPLDRCIRVEPYDQSIALTRGEGQQLDVAGMDQVEQPLVKTTLSPMRRQAVAISAAVALLASDPG